MKKLAFLLAALLVLTTLTAGATLSVAAATPSEGSCGGQGDNVTWSYNSAAKSLIISGKGDMRGYTSASQAPWYRYEIQSIVIGRGVTTVGRYAFADRSDVKSVSLPDTLVAIETGAFYGAVSLSEIVFPEKLKSIGNSAFCGCTKLTSITLPEELTSVGDGAFYNCKGVTEITIPASVTYVGYLAFRTGAERTDFYYYGSKDAWNNMVPKADYSDNYKVHFVTPPTTEPSEKIPVSTTPATTQKKPKPTNPNTLRTILEDAGCQTTLALGASLSLLATIAAAGVMMKKKED